MKRFQLFAAFATLSNLISNVYGDDCAYYTNVQTLSDGASTIHYVSTNTTLSILLNTTKFGWVAFGRSLNGEMIGSDAVIGYPSSGTVVRHVLTGKSVDLTLEHDKQNLINAEVQKTVSGTVMKFTQYLSDGPIPLKPRGPATFIWALGTSDHLNYHADRGSITLNLLPCTCDPTAVQRRKLPPKPAPKTPPMPAPKPLPMPAPKPAPMPPVSSDTYSHLQFYVMADIPYSSSEESILSSQISSINSAIKAGTDRSMFMVHLGDMMKASNGCSSSRYSTVSDIFKKSSIPVLSTPGDNDWTDCSDPPTSWSYYSKYFIGTETYWSNANAIASLIIRSTTRKENWVLWYRRVLFIAIDMVDAYEDSWSTRIQDNINWFTKHCTNYCSQARAIIILGHSTNEASTVFDVVSSKTRNLGIPVIYFNGNGHSFQVSRDVGGSDLSGDYFWRVQVDQGANAPPLRVTIRGNDSASLSQSFQATNSNQRVFKSMVMIDQRK